MISSLLIDPIREFGQIELLPESRKLALVASSLIQRLSVTDSGKRQSPLLAPVVAGWKPTILVVDDSSMNRKVESITHLSRTFPLTPV